jgi:hypothetical protein
MTQELDSGQVLAAAEDLLRKTEFGDKQIAIRVDDNHFIALAIFLVSICEARKKLLKEENHSRLASDLIVEDLVDRFDRTIDDDLPKFVDIKMSRIELDTVGNALCEGTAGRTKNPRLENKMRIPVYGAYLYFDSVFVKAGGNENISLRNDVKNLLSRVGKKIDL